jgi:hypothetical protein
MILKMTRYLTQKQAASYIGIAINTFKLHVRPFLKHKNLGRKVLFSQDEIDNFMCFDFYDIKRQLKRCSS